VARKREELSSGVKDAFGKKRVEAAARIKDKKRAARAKKVREDFAKLLSAHEESVDEALGALREEFDALTRQYAELCQGHEKLKTSVATLYSMEALSRAHGTEVAQRVERLKAGLAKAANG
jgi:hypothetical protein